MSAMTGTLASKTQVESLFKLENDLIVTARNFNLALRRSPPAIKNHLEFISSELATRVEDNLSSLLSTFAVCQKEDVNPWDDREFFRLSMKSLGVTYPSDFLGNVADGDLVEGYAMDRFQVFRNMRFMELSSYSLMEVLSNEWPLLFDRATAITEKMISYCDEILWTANRTIPFQIPVHFIRELRSEQRQVLEVTFKYISPLFSGPNRPFGLIGTCKVRPVLVKRRDDNLSFV